MAAISGNITHYNAHVVADQHCAGLDAETLLRIIGAVILAVAAIFLTIGCCLGLCEEDQAETPALAQRDVRQLNPGNRDLAAFANQRVNLPKVQETPQLQVRVGKINKAEKVTEASLAATQNLKINPKTLGVAPKPVAELMKVLNRDNNVERIDIRELLKWVNTLFDGSAEHGTVRTHISAYIQFIFDREDYESHRPNHDEYDHARWDAYFDELHLIAKNLVFEFENDINKDKIPVHKKRTALTQIADAKQHCRPRILEESRRQFLSVTGRLSMNDKLYRWAQRLKEDIIFEAFQTTQFHVINQARLKVGEKWGLDRDHFNLTDPHITIGRNVPAHEFDNALERGFTPARLVDTIRTLMVYDNDLPSAMDFLMAKMENDPDRDNIERYFELVTDGKDLNTVINCEGVAKFCELAGLLVKK